MFYYFSRSRGFNNRLVFLICLNSYGSTSKPFVKNPVDGGEGEFDTMNYF